MHVLLTVVQTRSAAGSSGGQLGRRRSSHIARLDLGSTLITDGCLPTLRLLLPSLPLSAAAAAAAVMPASADETVRVHSIESCQLMII